MPSNAPLIIDSADRVPPQPPTPPHQMINGAMWRQPPRARLDWPWHVSLVLGVLVLIPIGLIVYWLWSLLDGWARRNPGAAETGQWLIVALLFVLVVCGVAWAIVRLYLNLAERYGYALAPYVTRTRLGNAAPTLALVNQSLSDVARFEAAAIGMQVQIAPHQRHPLLSTLSEGNHEEATTTINGLADGDDTPGGVPPSDWLRWIDTTPHLLIAGRTNAGKTTLASAILAERIQGGDEVLIIDPHDQPDKWFGVQAVGGGRRYDEILLMLDRVVAEMDARYQQYNNGTPTAAFTRLTVLVDEVPAIMDACLNERRRIVDARWSNFARQLGSEARKVRISVILLTQSALVQDIGVNTAMRKNFSRIALGDETRQLLSEENNSERRKMLEDLIRGQAHPAVMEHKSEIHVLNTADVVTLAQQDVRSAVRVWLPSVWTAPAHASGRAPFAQTDRQTDGKLGAARKQALIYALRHHYKLSRDEARQRLAAIGEGLDNDDWAAAA